MGGGGGGTELVCKDFNILTTQASQQLQHFNSQTCLMFVQDLYGSILGNLFSKLAKGQILYLVCPKPFVTKIFIKLTKIEELHVFPKSQKYLLKFHVKKFFRVFYW